MLGAGFGKRSIIYVGGLQPGLGGLGGPEGPPYIWTWRSALHLDPKVRPTSGS